MGITRSPDASYRAFCHICTKWSMNLDSLVFDLLGCDVSSSDGRLPRFEEMQTYRRGFMNDSTYLLTYMLHGADSFLRS